MMIRELLLTNVDGCRLQAGRARKWQPTCIAIGTRARNPTARTAKSLKLGVATVAISAAAGSATLKTMPTLEQHLVCVV